MRPGSLLPDLCVPQTLGFCLPRRQPQAIQAKLLKADLHGAIVSGKGLRAGGTRGSIAGSALGGETSSRWSLPSPHGPDCCLEGVGHTCDLARESCPHPGLRAPKDTLSDIAGSQAEGGEVGPPATQSRPPALLPRWARPELEPLLLCSHEIQVPLLRGCHRDPPAGNKARFQNHHQRRPPERCVLSPRCCGRWASPALTLWPQGLGSAPTPGICRGHTCPWGCRSCALGREPVGPGGLRAPL